jgi:hypothetical protein
VGGLVMGVLSALPLINAGNICCCLWVVSGGVVAAYLLQQNDPAPISVADGALVGLLAGIIGAFAQFIISIPVSLVFGPMERAILGRSLEMAGSMPPELRQMLENYSNQQSELGAVGMVLVRIFGLFVALVIGAIFSTLGGVLGAAIFRKRLPPGTIDITPAP